MRIPCTIDKNTFDVYKNVKVGTTNPERNLTKRTIQSGDFEWDAKIIKSLQELCVNCVANNWKELLILEEILSLTDKCLLLEILSLDLPLELTIPRIDYDIYWKRCYVSRWPKQLPTLDTIEPVNISSGSSETDADRKYSVTNEDSNNVEDRLLTQLGNRDSLDSFQAPNYQNNDTSSKTSSTTEYNKNGRKTWKQHYVEMHINHFLENLKPEDYNAEQIKEVTDLCNPYVQKISVDQLLCAGSTANRVPLNAILTGFPYLRELSLCFKQTYVGENFSWNVVKITVQDVRLLAKGLEKCNLNCFRLTNSDIDGEKAILILKALIKNKKMRILDFSHCTIEDKGALAVSKFCLSTPVQEVNLANNKIGKNGAQALAYALSQPTCELTHVDLKLNSIRNAGASYIFGVLSSSNSKVTHIDLSACDITKKVQNLADVLKFNGRLFSIKLSNNKLGEDTANGIASNLATNRNIRILDIRMCNISSEMECAIRNQLESNRQRQVGHTLQIPEQTDKFCADFDEDIINEIQYILE